MGYLDGFRVTFRKLFEPRVTRNYSKGKGGKSDKAVRLHGRHVLNRYEDGMEKCIGCELCAGVCPARCIYVRGADNPPDDPVAPGERYGYIYEINYLRCIHCDLCVEACPTEAITESKLFEFSFTNRQDAIYTKAELVVGDDGRPRQLPWEDWTDLEKVESYTSAWMRATSPNGAAEHEGIVAWAGELGYGVRPAEQGQRAGDGAAHDDQADAPDGHDDDHAPGHDVPEAAAGRAERQGASEPMVEGRDEHAPTPEATATEAPRLEGAPDADDLPAEDHREIPPGTAGAEAAPDEQRTPGEAPPPSLPADNPGEGD